MAIVYLQYIIRHMLRHAVMFPVWWYGRGLIFVVSSCVSFLQNVNATLAPGLWLKNIFVPMFGQRDWQGRLMSIFMRFVNVIFRSIALLVVTLCTVIAFIVWLVWPLFVVSMMASSLIITGV